MFTCANCGKEKPDTERGSVGWFADIGLSGGRQKPLAAFRCVRGLLWTKVRLFGIVCVIVAGVALMVFGVFNR